MQQLAGHASPATTSRYDSPPDATRRRAAEMLHVPYVAPHPAPSDEDLGSDGPEPSAARHLDAWLDLRADDPVPADRPLSQREGTIRMQLDLAERHGHEQLAARLRDQLLRLGVDTGEVDDA